MLRHYVIYVVESNSRSLEVDAINPVVLVCKVCYDCGAVRSMWCKLGVYGVVRGVWCKSGVCGIVRSVWCSPGIWCSHGCMV